MTLSFVEATREKTDARGELVGPCGYGSRTPLARRFWSKVEIAGPDDCWLWNAATNGDGYGVIGLGGRGEGIIRAHHLSWEFYEGLPVPDGLIIRHMCEDRYSRGDITSRRCVNRRHLSLGNFKDNVEDCIRAGRNSPPPHYRGEKNPASSIPDTVVETVREMLTRGVSRRLVREATGVSKSHVGRIARGEAR
jgi:hypothetical protein